MVPEYLRIYPQLWTSNDLFTWIKDLVGRPGPVVHRYWLERNQQYLATLSKAFLAEQKEVDPAPRVYSRIKRAFPQGDYPYPDLFRAVEVSVEALEEADRERYLDLAVFPQDQPIPGSALGVLWGLDEIKNP
jgi:hypothetical protein